MGKTRDLFKKIRDTKGTFLAKQSEVAQSCLTLGDEDAHSKGQKWYGPKRSRRY